jgi:hypothetical protein
MRYVIVLTKISESDLEYVMYFTDGDGTGRDEISIEEAREAWNIPPENVQKIQSLRIGEMMVLR